MPDIKPMPDISEFTMDNLLTRIPLLQRGSTRIVSMEESPGLNKFVEGDAKARMQNLQDRGSPVAYEIQDGVYDLPALLDDMEKQGAMERNGDIYLLKMPLHVGPKATLIIRGTPGRKVQLHMSSASGAFLINSGLMFIADAEISGWNDDDDVVASLVNKYDFRPFITAWSGSHTYIGRSAFYSLGYLASKSYGLSYSSSKTYKERKKDIPDPTGWVIDSWFEDMYYGFYSYEAVDIPILRNVYANNIIYGIDPHDRSKRLIIAGNEAYGTHKKHGIIISREVNDSWIVNNVSHNNNRSGFMLDRSSVRNLVANNISYENGADGLTLFESQDNVIINNRIYRNAKNGMRIRNSWNIFASDNIVTQNGGVGVQVYAIDISETEEDRDFILDPFTRKASMTLTNSIVALNTSGVFKAESVDYFRLSHIEFLWDGERLFRGALNELSDEIAVGLRREPKAVEILHGTGDDAEEENDDGSEGESGE